MRLVSLDMLKPSQLYIRIWEDRVVVRNINSSEQVEVRPESDYTSTRLLVGDFLVAEQAILRGAATVSNYSLRKSQVLVQPMAKTEGGLSLVEERLYRELGGLSGKSAKQLVWVGRELADAEVREKLNAA